MVSALVLQTSETLRSRVRAPARSVRERSKVDSAFHPLGVDKMSTSTKMLGVKSGKGVAPSPTHVVVADE